MKLIVGLGNPGQKYQETRHNLGFMVLDKLGEKLTPVEKTLWQESKKFNAFLLKTEKAILLKPQTFMNASGIAVARVANFYKIKPQDIWVIHDEVDLPLGKVRIRLGGGTAGHRGIESIIAQLGHDQFVRFRLGIGHPLKGGNKEQEVERYVLQNFTSQEGNKAKQVIKKALRAILKALAKSPKLAANEYN